MNDLLDFLLCRNCKQEPSIAAHFDFILPEINEGPCSSMQLSAVIEMSSEMPKPFINNWFTTGMKEIIMQAQIDMYTVSFIVLLSNSFKETAFPSALCNRLTPVMYSNLLCYVALILASIFILVHVLSL